MYRSIDLKQEALRIVRTVRTKGVKTVENLKPC